MKETEEDAYNIMKERGDDYSIQKESGKIITLP